MPQSPDNNWSSSSVLGLAIWFGIVTGLVEGLALLAICGYGVIKTGLGKGVSAEIIWISGFLNLIIFVTAGALMLAAGRAISSLRSLRLAVGVCVALMAFDWIAVPLLTTKVHITTTAAAVLAVGLAVTFDRWYRKQEGGMMAFWRATLPFAVSVLLLSYGLIQGGTWLKQREELDRLPAASKDAPNIVVLVVDTLRADHLSLYGYARPTSPNLDKFAQQGVVFDQAISTSSWTLPSHASMLTGLLPHENGTVDGDPLDDRVPTLGEALESRGYRTAAFSGNNANFSRRSGLGRGFIYFDDYFYSLGDMFDRTVWGRVIDYHLSGLLHMGELPERQRAAEINRRMFAWVDGGHKRPFFVFLNYFDVHAPYLPPQPYRHRFSRTPNPGGLLTEDYYPHLTPEQMQSENDAYDGAITYVDEEIGQLLGGLRARGLMGNTIVVITADHGESLGDHGLVMHENSLYRELIHVPLVFWWAQKIPAGRRISIPVSTASLPATLLELVGEQDGRFPSPPLAKLWSGAVLPSNWPAPVSELTEVPSLPANYPAHSGDLESIYGPDWHLIRNEQLPPQLFAPRADPHELNNLANDPITHSALQQLSEALEQQVTYEPSRSMAKKYYFLRVKVH